MTTSQLKSLIKECVMEVLKEELSKEGFDPQSNAGPNVVGDPDFYRRTNSAMRQLEETEESNEHGRYAQEAGAGQFDNRTFGVNSKSS